MARSITRLCVLTAFISLTAVTSYVTTSKAYANEETGKPIERISVEGRRVTPLPSLFMIGMSSSGFGSSDHGGGGSSDFQRPNQGDKGDDEECKEGNPVLVSTGTKIEHEIDFEGFWQNAFSFERFYDSSVSLNYGFGAGWSSLASHRLTSAPAGGFLNVRISNEEGKTLNFSMPYTPPPGLIPDPNPPALTPETNPVTVTNSGANRLHYFSSNGHWTLYHENGNVHFYDHLGRLTRIEVAASGPRLNFFYNHLQLVRVEQAGGRSLHLEWTGQRITKMTDPNGGVYNYTYNQNNMLTLVRYPDGVTRTYHYEDSRRNHVLTGISINNIRYSWFTYDIDGRAITSRHANDIDKHLFTYDALSTSVTNPLGHTTRYFYTDANKTRLNRIESDGTPYCQAGIQRREYNSLGQISATTDWAGNRTQRSYQNGLLTSLRVGVGSGSELTTSYEYNLSMRLPTRITYPSGTIERFTYDSRRNITSHRTEADGVTSLTNFAYQYYANGMIRLRTITDSLGRNEIHEFSQTGDLVKSTNSLGHITTFSNYNGFGLPERVTLSNQGEIVNAF